MKIGILHYSAPPIVGGVESVIAEHARLMTQMGHSVTIIAGRGELFQIDIPVHIVPYFDSRHSEVIKVKNQLDQGRCPPAFNTLREKIAAKLRIELSPLDILIAHNIGSLHKNLALTAALSDVLKEGHCPKTIFWHHDLAWTASQYVNELYDAYPWNLLRTRVDGATQVVVSELRQFELSKLLSIPKDSIRVIPNGVDHKRFYKLETQTVQLIEKMNLYDADPLFLLPVRLTPRKNIELAIRVLVELKKEYPNAMLLVTGPVGPHNPANSEYREKIHNLINDLNLHKSAILLAELAAEPVPDTVISDFYNLADALFFPSKEEGFGIPIIEAGFSGIPVFCSDIPVFRELGQDDISYFNPNSSPRKIARDICSRLQSETTVRWSRKAKHNFAWDAIYTRFIEPLLWEVIK